MSAASLAARLSAGRHALHTLHMVARLPAAVLCCSEGGSARRDVDCARARAGAEGGGGGCVCKGGQEEHGKTKKIAIHNRANVGRGVARKGLGDPDSCSTGATHHIYGYKRLLLLRRSPVTIPCRISTKRKHQLNRN